VASISTALNQREPYQIVAPSCRNGDTLPLPPLDGPATEKLRRAADGVGRTGLVFEQNEVFFGGLAETAHRAKKQAYKNKAIHSDTIIVIKRELLDAIIQNVFLLTGSGFDTGLRDTAGAITKLNLHNLPVHYPYVKGIDFVSFVLPQPGRIGPLLHLQRLIEAHCTNCNGLVAVLNFVETALAIAGITRNGVQIRVPARLVINRHD
jgi:hypothetical protein